MVLRNLLLKGIPGYAIRSVGGGGRMCSYYFQVILSLEDILLHFFKIVGFSTFSDMYLLVNNTLFQVASLLDITVYINAY